MKKLKLMTIVGTRPEIIRLSSVIKECDNQFEHILVHTGQNWDYNLNEVFFNDLELRQPDHYLNAVGNHLGDTLGNIISKSYEIMVKENPDALLILGDTNSCLSAMSAKRLKIPIFHMEAGNRCFDLNVPEEINRRIVDHISDVNLPYTEHSRRYLLSEGLSKQYTFVTGSPMNEVLTLYADKIENSNALAKLDLIKDKYIIVSAHREENLDNDDNLEKLVESLNFVAETYNMPVIYSTHPRTKKKFESKNVVLDGRVRTLEPFGFFDYNCLQKNAFVVLSDSGTLSEEATMLKFPGVLLRTSTERPEVIDAGTVVIGGIGKENIFQSIEMARSLFKSENMLLPIDYADTKVSNKVVRIIQSYTKIINKFVWMK